MTGPNDDVGGYEFDAFDPTSLPLFASRTAGRAEQSANGWAHNGHPQPAVTGPQMTGTTSISPKDRAAIGYQPNRDDWSLVAGLRDEAADLLSATIDAEDLDVVARRQKGLALIRDLVHDRLSQNVTAGRDAWSSQKQAWLRQALDDALFGLGRLQPLVEREDVENIIINGCDRVFLDLVDGSRIEVEPVADSDEELIAFLQFVAERRFQSNPRTFSEAVPSLDLRLPGGYRLAATAWVTPRPAVVIRRHGLRQATLEELVHDKQTITPTMADFLRAAVRAGKSIVVAGPQGAGKTTTVRALCACIDPWEVIGTFETEYELHLHEMPDKHKVVFAWEARPGTGEVDARGAKAGEFTLDQALIDSFRYALSRQIVGEVRGPEIWAMIKAMESGAGSLSTTHGRNSLATIEKLITCAMEAGASRELAISKLAQTVDLIVQLSLKVVATGDGGYHKSRWVSEVITVAPGERDLGYATQHIFKSPPGATLSQVVGKIPDDLLADLVAEGFDVHTFEAEARNHGVML